MEIIRELKEIPNLSLALGFFDGVHLGHQAVISCAVDFAKEINSKSAVITFKEHPFCYFKGVSPKYILTLEDKYKYMAELGLDYVFELDFGSVCHLTPAQYLEDVLIKYFSPKAISTGFNHHFGVDKSGNVKFLSDSQSRFDYLYFATPPQSIYGDVISSTAIRHYIKVTSYKCTIYKFYILKFKGNLYDKNIKVSFNKMIRPEIKFANIDELRTQIDIDIQSL